MEYIIEELITIGYTTWDMITFLPQRYGEEFFEEIGLNLKYQYPNQKWIKSIGVQIE